MQSRMTGRSQSHRRVTSVALCLTALTTAVAAAAPAQAADDVLIKLSCTDPSKTFKVNATLEGSGAPTAKYNVTFRTTDYIDDTRAPKLRLTTNNKDGSYTAYPWHTGAQGRSVISEWSSTLQQPKGIRVVMLEGTVDKDSALFQCSDYAPKS